MLYPTYVAPEHFPLLYQACDVARTPGQFPFAAADWWRGVLTFAYMTGWRIGSILALRWEDVDLKAATAVSRARDNKGRRDQKIPLHPLLVEHLRKMASFDPCCFPWNQSRRALFAEFERLQDAAGVKPGRLEALLYGAIADAQWCSRGPLCIESHGQGIDSLNRAACYACALVPETSCEEGNRFLDRAALVGTADDAKTGFFWELAKEIVEEVRT